MSELFSNKKINVGRQLELDIAKGLSIIFMIFMYCLMVGSVFNNSISAPFELIFGDILGKPCAAPILMFCMGVGIVYSSYSRPTNMIKRGVKLFLLGILVNIFEFFLPNYLSGILLNEWTLFPTAGGLLLFFVDVLAFAGLALILIGILKKFKIPDNSMLTLAILLSLLGSVFRFTDLGSDVLNLILGNFIGTEGGFTVFPLFNWLIFPITGYVWGQYFIRCTDKDKFFKSWPIFLIVSLLYFIFSTQIIGGFLMDAHNYYFMTTLDVIFCLMYIHGNLGLCYFMKDRLPEAIIKVFSILSDNINVIYIVQWFVMPLLIILVVYLFKDIVFTDLLLLILSIFVLIISTASAMLYKSRSNKKVNSI
jgi:hypothetical protein